MKNKYIKYTNFLVVITLLLTGFGFIANASWVTPPSSPPDNNAPTPLNVSNYPQTKDGNLTIGGNLNTNGNITAIGNVFGQAFLYTSDRRLKNDIEPLSDNLINDILKLQGVSYTWKEGGKSDIGLIAQEVEELYPDLVVTSEESGYKSVEYAGLIAPLIEITKAQQERIDLLESRIEILEREL